jgi:hypothetical protein
VVFGRSGRKKSTEDLRDEKTNTSKENNGNAGNGENKCPFMGGSVIRNIRTDSNSGRNWLASLSNQFFVIDRSGLNPAFRQIKARRGKNQPT